MPAGPPQENKNAQKYTLKFAIELFNKSIELAKIKTDYVIGQNTIKGYEYHFLGEIATSDEIDTYTDVFLYLKNTYPQCEELYNKLKNRLEANCFSDSKKGIIKEATAIMNLKSNYKWTDRLDNTTEGKAISQNNQFTFKVIDKNDITE